MVTDQVATPPVLIEKDRQECLSYLSSIVGINDARAEAAAVITVVVVVDEQVQSPVGRGGKRCLVADQENLRGLAIRLKYVTNQRADTRGRQRTSASAEDRPGTEP